VSMARLCRLRSFLIPHSTNQSGFLNCAVAGNKRQSRDSGLCDNETIIGIRNSCKGCSLKEQLHVVDAQIEVVCLRKRNDQVAEWQGNANFAGFGKKHQFFENRKRNKYAIDAPLHPLNGATRSAAKASVAALM
jgi:hypothetical protein